MVLLLPMRNMALGGLEGTSKKSLSAPMAGVIIESPMVTADEQHAALPGSGTAPERLSRATRPTAPLTTTPAARAPRGESILRREWRSLSKSMRIMNGS